ncbi:unnamed protein product [Orchesella dallaii]|uniref:RING-type E3 ubiquitin transferase n=1 Tax=Orchesella dallaii TaxID=48710 RepID=A0ABP1R4E8_9HEXA
MSRLTRAAGRRPLTRSRTSSSSGNGRVISISSDEEGEDLQVTASREGVVEEHRNESSSSSSFSLSSTESPPRRIREMFDNDIEVILDDSSGSFELDDSDVELVQNSDEDSNPRPGGFMPASSPSSSNQSNQEAVLASPSSASSPGRLSFPALSAVAQRMTDELRRVLNGASLPARAPTLNSSISASSSTSAEPEDIAEVEGILEPEEPEVVEVFNLPEPAVEVVVGLEQLEERVLNYENEIGVVGGGRSRPPSPIPGPSHGNRQPSTVQNQRRRSLGEMIVDVYRRAVEGTITNNGESEASDQEDDDVQNDSNEAEENGPPPQKMPRLDTSVRSDDEEGFMCTICYEYFTNSGEHRVCCLKCGHVFGKNCIEKWINTQKRCPQCNCKAVKRDIRVLYVKNLKVMDTAELDRVKKELQDAKEERSRVDLSNAHLRAQVDLKSREITRLYDENKRLKISRSSTEIQEVIDVEPRPVRGSESASHMNMFSSLRMPKAVLIKRFDIKEGSARVGAYNEWMNLLVTSHGITSALYPNGCYGIKKINTLDMKAFQSFPVHQRALRDMAFSQAQNDLLLTVGLDKKAVLFNCNSNCPVQTFPTESPLWSCCWNSVDQNIFYVGNVTGKIISYDIRAPQEPLSTLDIPTPCKDAAARLKFVPPAYQNQTFNMSGLLVQKLNSTWFCEMLGGNNSDPRFHQLPLEGPFLNADFEPSSRHVLVSSRPKVNAKIGTSHVVCTLGKVYSDIEQRDVFNCEIVQSIYVRIYR